MQTTSAAAAAFALLASASAASAAQPSADAAPAPQEAPAAAVPQPEPEAAADDIVVTAGRPRGSVDGNIQPDLTLNAQDIRAYGASSIEDLLTQLGPQTRSGRGRGGEMPVVLINGRRVSGFGEIRTIPPEAIERVDILPEETALSYGYRADQRVVNFVLRERFRAFTGEIELGAPTAGGRQEVELDGNLLRIEGDSRVLLDVSLASRSALLESSRSILQPAQAQPFSVSGNITGLVPGAEIDPALSALAGGAVTVAAVPASAAAGAPALAAFAATAGQARTTDTAPFRTLLPETLDLSAGGSIARPLGERVQMTLSARATSSSSESRLGLATSTLTLPAGNPFSPFGQDVRLLNLASAPGPLLADRDSWTGRLAAAFNGDMAGWRWSLTASHDHSESRTLTDRSLNLSEAQARLDALDAAFNPFAPNAINGPMLRDRATSNVDRSLVEAVAGGRLADLPAGGLSASVRLGLDHRDLESFARRGTSESAVALKRTQGNAQASVDLPIASRRRDVLAFLGDLSVNANAEVEQLSDFGSLVTWGGGVTWRPVEPLQLIASYTSEQGAPDIQQLGNPLVATPNVRVFDYVRGETVDIVRLDGGNPDLSADRRRIWKLGGRLQPIADTDFSLQADYVNSRITGPIASFPTATAEIEAAFPDRFVRDADGRLLQIDNRPVNFARSQRSELRWGFNFSERLEPSRAEREAMARRRVAFEQRRKEAEAAGKPLPAPPAWMQQRPGGGPPGGGPGGRGGGMGEGRLQLSLFHTWRFTDEILIREGVPVLDLLDGSATGSSGGVPRHLVEGRVGVNKNGLGARLSANWQSGTQVRVTPDGPPSPDDLSFSSLATVDLRLFADLGQRFGLVRRVPFLRGARVSIGIDNIFDNKLDVRDRANSVPINYQPDLIDPVGRRIEVSFRKIFF